MKKISFKSKIFRWDHEAGTWYFARTPEKESSALRALPRPKKRGFGSIKVRATIGKTMWDTSLFPTKEGPYLLPLKASVRKKEALDDGDTVKIECVLI